MDVIVEISQSDDNQIQMVVHGAAKGIIYFRDKDMLYAFIEKCADFVYNHEGYVEALAPIPEPFLEAFNDN